MPADGPILVAGAGIAGLTAALAFARRGFRVQVFERAERLEEAGAGIQLSPNATRILFALGLRDSLLGVAARPEAVCLIDAASLRDLAQVPLGAWGEERWGAPYLTCRRADLQRVLLDAVAEDARISLQAGARAAGADLSGEGAQLFLTPSGPEPVAGALLVAADGVHSALRASLSPGTTQKPSSALPMPGDPLATGLTAWRAAAVDRPAPDLLRPDRVCAFLKPQAHLVAYPTGAGAFNLVAFAPTHGGPGSAPDLQALRAAFADAAPALRDLVERCAWSAWPLLTAPEGVPWVFGTRAALVGDAAHAMTPFAAQGAATAIEDAYTLAAAYAGTNAPPAGRLADWEAQRRARVARIVRRGRLNRLTWHAGGLVALARNLAFRLLPARKLATDLDWLYGWRPD